MKDKIVRNDIFQSLDDCLVSTGVNKKQKLSSVVSAANLMFSDIAGSTKIAIESIKYVKGYPYLYLIAFHHLAFMKSIKENNGLLRNKWGDGMLCTFQNPISTIRACFDVQNEVIRQRKTLFDIIEEPLIIRFGLHDGDFYTLPLGWEEKFSSSKQSLYKVTPPLEYISLDECIGSSISVAQRIQSLENKDFEFLATIFASGTFLTKMRNKIEVLYSDTTNQKMLIGEFFIGKEKYLALEYKFCTGKSPEMKNVLNPPSVYVIENLKSFVAGISKSLNFDENAIINHIHEKYKLSNKDDRIKKILIELKRRSDL